MRATVGRLLVAAQTLARRWGWDVHRHRPEPPPVNLLALAVADLLLPRVLAGGTTSGLTFLQIGAHDGTTGDLLRPLIERYDLRGVCVEPQPDVAARLRVTYRDRPGVAVEEAAVSEHDGTKILYRFRPGPLLPPYADLLASFSRDLLVRNAHGVRGEVEELPVRTICIPTLLSAHDLRPDIVQVDAEGYDAEIVRLLLPHMQPAIINFEHGAISRDERHACFLRLHRAGYAIARYAHDALAYRQPTADTAPVNDWRS